MKTHDYEKFAKEYANLKIEGSFYLNYRDIPYLVKKYSKGTNALDFGCGGGTSTQFLKSLELETIGVDISSDMIREAKKKDPKGTYLQIEEERIPCDDKKFDLCFSSLVFLEIGTLEEMNHVLVEINRVLKDEGLLIITTGLAEAYTRNWNSFLSDWPENVNLKSGDRAKVVIRGTEITLYDYVWSDEDYKKTFIDAGFEVLETLKPMATGDEPFELYAEKDYPLFTVYVLKKVT